MQIQPVNQYAARRYAEFETALESVHNALLAADPLVRSMREGKSRRGDFQLPDKKEVQAVRGKSGELLSELRREAKRYEAELMSRGWRP